MPGEHPHTVSPPDLETYDPPHERLPPEMEDIPRALEFKLDAIINRLNRLDRKIPPRPAPRKLPNPHAFDPEKNAFPVFDDLSDGLEFKLDVIIVLLNRALNWLIALAANVAVGLLALCLLLAWIGLGVWGMLTNLALILALLTALFALIAFFVIRLVVPLIRRWRF